MAETYRNRPGRGGRAGFSLWEIALALTLMALVMGSSMTAMQSGSRIFRRYSSDSRLVGHGASAIARIVEELFAAREASLTPQAAAPLGSDFLEFLASAEWKNGALEWDAPTRIAFEPGAGEVDVNGVDDDGDGLVDEGRVVLVRNLDRPNEQRVVVVEGLAPLLEGETANGADDNGNGLVDERGLSFQRAGDTLIVRLTLQGLGPDDEVILHTVATSVTLEN